MGAEAGVCPEKLSLQGGGDQQQGLLMGAVHQVGVDPAGGGGGAVSHGFADVEQRDALGRGDGGEGVAQSMEGEPGKVVLPHEPGEGQGQGVGGVGQSLSVQHHMSRGGVIPAPDGPLLLLPGLLPAEQLIELVRHKQGAHGGAVFCLLL